MKSRYTLAISFTSNERPWSTVYEPVREIIDEDDAKRWRDDMAEGMGSQYLVTLLCDGEALDK